MLQNLHFTFKIVFKRRRGGPTVKRNVYLIKFLFYFDPLSLDFGIYIYLTEYTNNPFINY